MVILTETIKEFKRCKIQATISDSAHSNSEEQVDTINNSEELVDAVSNPKSNPNSNPKVPTYTTNRNFPQKILKNWFILKIIQGEILPIDQLVTEDMLGILETLAERQTVLPKYIITYEVCSGVHISGL